MKPYNKILIQNVCRCHLNIILLQANKKIYQK